MTHWLNNVCPCILMKHEPLTLTHVNTLIVCGLPSPLPRLIVLQSQYDLTLMWLEFFLML
jgi:hypothetical protein